MLLSSQLIKILSEGVTVYIEKYNRSSNVLLLDFLDSNQAANFAALIGIATDWENRATMISISNYHLKAVRNGSYYRLNTEAWTEIMSLNLLTIVNDSFIVGYSIELPDDFTTNLFIESISFNWADRIHLNIDQSGNFDIPTINLVKNSSMQVIVKNVGQGSWNEISWDSSTRIIFDCGILYNTKKTIVKQLASTKDTEYQKSKPCLVISHWDVDHYHLLLGFDDSTIKSFSYIMSRSIVPNLTARKVHSRLRKLNSGTHAIIPPELLPPGVRKSPPFLRGYSLTKSGSILFFNGSQNRTRNVSSMGLLIRTKKTSVSLTSDLHYKQVSTGILQHISYPHKHYLVVPHHGGNAGKFVYNIHKKVTLRDAIVSVGKNPYSHPDKKNMNDLKSVGFNVVRTDIYGKDYVITL